jgi:hypothetical protein
MCWMWLLIAVSLLTNLVLIALIREENRRIAMIHKASEELLAEIDRIRPR